MCKELFLIIEVDGITHQDERVIENDKIRQAQLEVAGFTILRFTDDEVLKNIKGVINTLEDWIEKYEARNQYTIQQHRSKRVYFQTVQNSYL
jgi:very-short-patch-repair endonuclease